MYQIVEAGRLRAGSLAGGCGSRVESFHSYRKEGTA